MLTHYHPLLAHRFTSMMQSDRLADAEERRRVRALASEPGAPQLGTMLRVVDAPAPTDLDLADWMTRSGHAIAGIDADDLDAGRRTALAGLIAQMVAVARDGGVDLGVAVDADDSAALLQRAHGVLAQRTVGRAIPVSTRRRLMLESLLVALTGEAAPATSPSVDVVRAA